MFWEAMRRPGEFRKLWAAITTIALALPMFMGIDVEFLNEQFLAGLGAVLNVVLVGYSTNDPYTGTVK